MSRKLFAISLVFSFLLCNRAGATQYAYQVTFKDKNNTPYNLLSPLSYLSPRSVLRRSAQGIAIDSTDLPVNQAYIDSVLFLTGGILHERSKWLNMCVILVSDPSVMSVLSGISFAYTSFNDYKEAIKYKFKEWKKREALILDQKYRENNLEKLNNDSLRISLSIAKLSFYHLKIN